MRSYKVFQSLKPIMTYHLHMRERFHPRLLAIIHVASSVLLQFHIPRLRPRSVLNLTQLNTSSVNLCCGLNSYLRQSQLSSPYDHTILFTTLTVSLHSSLSQYRPVHYMQNTILLHKMLDLLNFQQNPTTTKSKLPISKLWFRMSP